MTEQVADGDRADGRVAVLFRVWLTYGLRGLVLGMAAGILVGLTVSQVRMGSWLTPLTPLTALTVGLLALPAPLSALRLGRVIAGFAGSARAGVPGSLLGGAAGGAAWGLIGGASLWGAGVAMGIDFDGVRILIGGAGYGATAGAFAGLIGGAIRRAVARGSV